MANQEFGIGRVPADVDADTELSAQMEAARIMAARTRYSERVLADCGHWCARAVLMNATVGTSCPACYDDSEE